MHAPDEHLGRACAQSVDIGLGASAHRRLRLSYKCRDVDFAAVIENSPRPGMPPLRGISATCLSVASSITRWLYKCDVNSERLRHWRGGGTEGLSAARPAALSRPRTRQPTASHQGFQGATENDGDLAPVFDGGALLGRRARGSWSGNVTARTSEVTSKVTLDGLHILRCRRRSTSHPAQNRGTPERDVCPCGCCGVKTRPRRPRFSHP